MITPKPWGSAALNCAAACFCALFGRSFPTTTACRPLCSVEQLLVFLRGEYHWWWCGSFFALRTRSKVRLASARNWTGLRTPSPSMSTCTSERQKERRPSASHSVGNHWNLPQRQNAWCFCQDVRPDIRSSRSMCKPQHNNTWCRSRTNSKNR